jgi:hypothetical protein
MEDQEQRADPPTMIAGIPLKAWRSGQAPQTVPAMETMEDALGFTYRSVRFCDLERISNK